MTSYRYPQAQKAFELAETYERKCTGCAQTTLAGIFDALDIENEDVFKAASGLADGIGLTGNGSCGALVGAAMAIGHLFGRERKDFSDMMAPMDSYLMVKSLHDRFMETFGHIRCHDIQHHLMGRTYNLLDPEELRQAFADNMVAHCSRVTGTAAAMAAEIILDAQNKPNP
ncbi:MAG: C_GCAxxG_C_C family protein [Desulfobacterales bacterium]|nr:C_GCAxxG_C_C family protein [Desulfobacterales bacterium]